MSSFQTLAVEKRGIRGRFFSLVSPVLDDPQWGRTVKLRQPVPIPLRGFWELGAPAPCVSVPAASMKMCACPDLAASCLGSGTVGSWT